ncbi:MAG: cyclic nucleotide-binding domain-containing protein [Planctomycetota bacterium]
MEKDTIDVIIAQHAFFSGLREEYLKLIAGCGRNVRFNAGETLFREGEEADQFYAIRHGRVAIEVHAPGRGSVMVQTVAEGELVGWSWLFPPYRWQFDARSLEVVRATAFDGECLRTKCDADPALGYELMKRFAQVMSQRLEATRLQLLDVYGPNSSS